MFVHYINCFNNSTFYCNVEMLNGVSLLILVMSIVFIFLTNNNNIIALVSLFSSFSCLLIYMFIFYNIGSLRFIYLETSQSLCEILFHLDDLSILFALMTSYIVPLCILYSIRLSSIGTKFLVLCLLTLEIIVLFCFTTRNLLLFFIAFEFVIVPMMILILNYGSRGRKIYAFISFFIYTFLGSIFLLLGIFVIYDDIGTLNFDMFLIQDLSDMPTKIFVLFCFLIGFAVKIPTMPVHVWLPEAHVEAPTVGSVILASLLLKLGGYGIIRVILPLTSDVLMYFRYIPITFCLISSIYATFLAFRHFDTKKIIAYSSIAHMNLSVIGLFMESKICFIGAVLSMLSHSLIAGALFFIAGFLYEKFHTRNILYYSALYSSMYFLYFFIFFFIFANMSFPGICSFIGELFIYIGIANTNIYLLFLTGPIMFFTGLFSCVLLYRLVYFNSEQHVEVLKKNLNNPITVSAFNVDLNKKVSNFNLSEFVILFILFSTSLFLFFFPDLFIYSISHFVTLLIY